MKKKFLKKKKGFTMVELLAVITILGIISVLAIGGVSQLLEKARKKEISEQKRIVELAAQSYIQYNKGKAPKKKNQYKNITLSELKNNNFLKEDVKSPDGKSCMSASYVRVTKLDDNKNLYKYEVTLSCGGAILGMNEVPTPNITANLIGNKNSLIDLEILMNFFGGENKDGKKSNISGYSYTFYSKDYDEKDYKKAYESGFIQEYDKIQTKSLKERICNFVNINNVESIMIQLEVRNKDGGIGEFNSIIL